MFRARQSQIMSNRLDRLANILSGFIEKAVGQQVPAYATPIRVTSNAPNDAARRRRSRRGNSISTGVSLKSTWY